MANSEPAGEYTVIEEYGGVEIMKTPVNYAVFFDIDTHGDGFATDREMEVFDTEEEARQFFAQILQQ